MDKYLNIANRTSKRYRIYSHMPRENSMYPITLEIFPTNNCNTNCKFCAFAEIKNREYIPFEVLDKFITDLKDSTIKSVVFSGGGEPLIYPEIASCINKLVANNIDVGVITNGLYLPNYVLNSLTLCKWVRFSLLQPNAKQFSEITGTSLNNHRIICNNIHKFTAHSKNISTLYVSASYMTNTGFDTLELLYDFLYLAHKLNIDQIFLKRLVNNFMLNEEVSKIYSENIEQISKLAERLKIVTNIKKYISIDNNKYKRREAREPCDILRMNLIGLIDAKGNYYPCLYQYVNSGYKYGNIKENNLEEILNNRWEFIKEIEKKPCEFCRHWSLRSEIAQYKKSKEIKECSDPHFNFI